LTINLILTSFIENLNPDQLGIELPDSYTELEKKRKKEGEIA